MNLDIDIDLEYKFNKYIFKVKKLDYISDNDKLYLYALYKQANFGDNSTDKPSIFNRIAIEKWKAWLAIKGLSNNNAKKEYISKVKELCKNTINNN